MQDLSSPSQNPKMRPEQSQKAIATTAAAHHILGIP